MLYPLSLFYTGFVKLREFLYKSSYLKREKFPVFVIGVGNLTMGGTGKTPLVIGLANILIDKGLRVGIISKGYKRKTKGEILVSDGKNIFVSDPSLCGDEPYLIALRTKAFVAVGSDRVKAFSLIKEFSPQVVILDDAFQHVKVVKDLDLCLIDGTRCWGNGLVFPAGALREPLSALGRAHAVVLTKAFNTACFLNVKGILNKIPVFSFLPRISHFLNKGKKVSPPQEAVVVTCVANPQNFIDDLKKLGIKTKNIRIFPDHHRFSFMDFKGFEEENIIITEKDWVNLPHSLKESDRIFVAVQKLDIPQDFKAFLEEKLAFK